MHTWELVISTMWWMSPCHCCDECEITIWWHTAFCWIFKFFYDCRFICIMLCLCYSSFRCLHGESRYTTYSTWVGVTLDYVDVSNYILTQTIALFLYFLKLAMVHRCSFLALQLSTTFSTMSTVRGELFVVSCPRVLVVLNHPVTVECPCWMIFKASVSAVLHL
jgi:hypothetical protein